MSNDAPAKTSHWCLVHRHRKCALIGSPCDCDCHETTK